MFKFSRNKQGKRAALKLEDIIRHCLQIGKEVRRNGKVLL